MLGSLIEEIKQSTFYTIIADEGTAYNRQYMSFCVRYVDTKVNTNFKNTPFLIECSLLPCVKIHIKVKTSEFFKILLLPNGKTFVFIETKKTCLSFKYFNMIL